MESEKIQELYTAKLRLYHQFTALACYRAGLKAALGRLPNLRAGMRVLDAGCGSGALTRALYEISLDRNLEGLTFHSFDFTEAMLEKFRAWIQEIGAGNVVLHQADVLEPEQLPDDWKDYDLIVSSGMLEYVPRNELKNALSYLGERLVSDGRILIFISRRNVLMRGLMAWWWQANIYSRTELEETLAEAGFGHVTIGGFPWPYWHLNLWGYVVDARR